MISRTGESSAVQRLSDLRSTQSADVTLRNLLGVLTAKLELCSRLPVFEWEASNEGREDTAIAFRTLAEMERRSSAAVIDCLRAHLEQRAGLATGGSA